MKSALKSLGVLATAGMFAVLVMGAAVTNTGSEQGCGKQWPLCHGQLIPQMAIKTAIEFSHRAVVGVETILIIVLAVGSLLLYRRRREIQILAPLMVAFLFLQAGLGAWAVVYPQESAILALHFGVSLISFASVLLTAVYLFEVDNRRELRDHHVSSQLRLFTWGVAAFTYSVVYMGAYVRHTHANLACGDWPLCNGSVVPPLRGTIATAFAHRVGAATLTMAIVGLVYWMSKVRVERPDLFGAAAMALVLVLLQGFSGALVVWTRLDIFSTLTHAGLVGLLFGDLAYLCVHVLPRRLPEDEGAGWRIRPHTNTRSARVPR
jgi:cytochrome c oxidase assembly protein subunit 15